jgi:WD40 repeat protein
MKYIILCLLFFTTLYGGKLIAPQDIYTVSSGLVTDILYNKNILYVATDAGDVELFDTVNKKKTDTIVLDKITDFMGDAVNSKVFTLDMLDGTLLILSQDSGGYSRIHFYKDGKLQLMISKAEHLNIIKAKFIDKDTILLALISNDIISYNIRTKKQNWDTQASMSKFSSFALNNDRTEVAVGDESGDVHLLDLKTGKKIKTLTGQNVDNIFSVAYRGTTVMTGGQDRRAAVYNVKTGSGYHKSSNFFVYGVGLSPSGAIGAYSSDLKNNVTLFNTNTRETIAKYSSSKAVVNGIYFINEKEFFINDSSKRVGYYKVK